VDVKHINNGPRHRHGHTMHENSLWKGVYYDALVCRNIPIATILLVTTAHYACCVGITKHDVGSGTHERFIGTPFRPMNRKIELADNNASAPNNTIPENWNMRDPLSFIYDSYTTLTLDRSNTLNPPNTTLKADQVDAHTGITQVCVMHTISLASFIALWLPTTYTNFSTKSSALWTIGSISVCCSVISWSLCMSMYSFEVLRKLSLCTAMHLTMQLLDALGFLTHKDPSIPIYMPIWVARGVSIAQGMLLCYIAYCGGSMADFDTTQFYMSHVWAVGISELVKIVILGPITVLIGMTVTTKIKYD
jgi:hypothetical protein